MAGTGGVEAFNSLESELSNSILSELEIDIDVDFEDDSLSSISEPSSVSL